jgi:hypothetical protein
MDDRSAVVRDLVFNNLDVQRVGLVDQFAEFVERPEILLSSRLMIQLRSWAPARMPAPQNLSYIRADSRRIP